MRHLLSSCSDDVVQQQRKKEGRKEKGLAEDFTSVEMSWGWRRIEASGKGSIFDGTFLQSIKFARISSLEKRRARLPPMTTVKQLLDSQYADDGKEEFTLAVLVFAINFKRLLRHPFYATSKTRFSFSKFHRLEIFKYYLRFSPNKRHKNLSNFSLASSTKFKQLQACSSQSNAAVFYGNKYNILAIMRYLNCYQAPITIKERRNVKMFSDTGGGKKSESGEENYLFNKMKIV